MGGGKKILIVDDHPLAIQGIMAMLKRDMPTTRFSYETALNCKESYEKISFMKKENTSLDLALVDISLPACEEKNIHSGLEVGLLIRNLFPNTKIIIATAFTDKAATKVVLEKLHPEALVCKTDIGKGAFSTIFNAIDTGEIYISSTIQKTLRKDVAKKLGIDTFDFEILHYLHKRISTKELPNYIELSLSAIEKRKASLKFLITGKKCTDTELIEKAKELHLI